MQASNRTCNILATLSVVLIGATVWTPARESAARAPVAAPTAGVFTGEFDHGVPVYRLPSVTITTTRSAELARMAQEEQVARK